LGILCRPAGEVAQPDKILDLEPERRDKFDWKRNPMGSLGEEGSERIC
jgi:hypothetical protein